MSNDLKEEHQLLSPSGIRLYSHQAQSAKFLLQGSRADWSDMGSGKTFSSLMADLLSSASTTVILHPLIARGMWMKEINAFYGSPQDIQTIYKGKDKINLGHRFILIPDSLVAKIKDQLLKCSFDNLIIDEAHKYKSPSAARTKALYGARVVTRGIVSRAKRVWPLTGTPMPNNPAEIWTTVRALAPDLIKNESGRTMSYAEFIVRYCHTRETPYGTKILGGKDLPTLNERIRGFYIRHRIKDVLPDLPPVTLQDIPIEMSAAEMRELQKTIEELELSPDFFDWDLEAISTVQALTGALKIPIVYEHTKELLENGCENVIVFFMNRALGLGLAERLESYGVSLVIGGSDKEKEVLKFQEGRSRVMLANITIASTALNLQNCHRVVFGQQSFTPGDNAQALKRAARIGQTHHVHGDIISMKGTIDERVEASLTMKTKMILEALQEDSMI